MQRNLYRVSTLCGLILVTAHVVFARAAQENKTVEAPFSFDSGDVVLQVKIKGKGPYNMVLATGYPTSKIAPGVVEEMKILGKYSIASEGLLAGYVYWYDVPDIQIGGLNVGTVTMNTGNFSNLSQRLGLTVHGVLGFDFLKRRVVQLDYPRRVIRFMQAATGPDVAGTRLTAKHAVVPMSTEAPVTVIGEVYVNGKKLRALLDTSQGGSLALTPSALKYLNLPIPAEKSPPHVGAVDAHSIGTMSLAATEVTFLPKDVATDIDLGKYGAIVGNGLLSHYVVTLDYPRHTVTFEQP
jgi:hypothetical protein